MPVTQHPTVEPTVPGPPAVRRFGRYELLERVGEGGMGVVWRALASDGRPVAVKVLRTHLAADPQVRRRFEREVSMLARIRGPHIAEVVEAEVGTDLPYLVTRFVDGPSLHDVVDGRGPLRGSELRTLALGLLDALECIHAAGVVHRDLKPGNVLLEDGEPRVIDFGIAQLTHDVRLTMTGMVFGTPGYLAPELLRGAEPTPAVDVHAWGATVAFAATGRSPFGRGTLEAVALAVMQRQPDLGGVDRWLEPALAAALAKDPDERPTAAELTDWFTGGRFTLGQSIDPAAAVTGAVPLPTWVEQSAGRSAGPTTGPRSVREAGSIDRGIAPQPMSQPTPSPDRPPVAPYAVEPPGPDRDELLGLPARTPASAATWAATVAPGSGGLEAVSPAVARTGLRRVLPVVLAWGFGWACATAVAPILGLTGLAVWGAVAHTSTSLERLRRLRPERSPLRSGAAAAAASPWFAVRGLALGALAVGAGAAVSAALLVSVFVLARLVGLTGLPVDLLFVGTGGLAALYAWYGFGGGSLRRGTVGVLGAATRVRYGRVVTTTLGLLLGIAALYVASATDVSLWPLPIDAGSMLDRWGTWFGASPG